MQYKQNIVTVYFVTVWTVFVSWLANLRSERATLWAFIRITSLTNSDNLATKRPNKRQESVKSNEFIDYFSCLSFSTCLRFSTAIKKIESVD